MKYKLKKTLKPFLGLILCFVVCMQSIPVYGTEIPESGILSICLTEAGGKITVSAAGYDDAVIENTGEERELEYPVGTEVKLSAEASDQYVISKVQMDAEEISEFDDPVKFQTEITVKKEKTQIRISFSGTAAEDSGSTQGSGDPISEYAAAAISLDDMDDSEEGDVSEEEDLEEEGEDIPDGEVDYGTEMGTVNYTVGNHGTLTVDGEAVSSSKSISYEAGTQVKITAKADSGYDIDEIFILDDAGNYLEYVVGFDSAGSHSMSFGVYGGMTQSVHVTFTEEETEDPFDGAEGTVIFKKTIDTSLSRIDSGTVYRGGNGELAYCGNANAHGPGTSGTSMKLDTSSAYQHAYDYIMYYGYPKHTTIYGTKYSKKDAHDITQWAIWLIRDPSYYRGTFAANPTLAAVAKKLAKAAGEYNGGNDKIDGTCLIYYPSSSKKQPMVILNESQPKTGKLKLKKSSNKPDVTDGNSCYTLEGAAYVVYSDSACNNKVASLETKADGSTSTVELTTGTYYVREATASDGYTVSSTKSKITIKTGTTTTLKVQETPGTAYLSLEKKSANKSITDGNSCYNLSGAVYTVYTDSSCTAQAVDADGNQASLTTDSDGKTPELELYLGNYWVKETQTAEGYAIDGQTYKVELKEKDQHYKGNGTSFKEEPQSGYFDILLQKVDRETKKAAAQGSASLADAEFTVQYYDGKYSVEEAKARQAKRTWKFQTDADGKAKYTDDPQYFIGGDPLYYDSNGKLTMPLGTVLVTETKEPKGYLIDETTEKIWIEKNGTDQTARISNYAVDENAIKDQIRRADLQLMKYGENKDDDFSGIRKPLEGVEFTITSKTTKESWKIVTDENGVASTKSLGISDRGNLVYDTYIVEETKNPYSEYDRIQPFEAVLEPSVEEDGKTYYYGIVNMEIYTPIQVVKADRSTGKTIPIADTEFQILDADQNVIELTVSQYPKKQTATSFRTDETGSFTFPELFDAGTYYLKEVHSPYGYLLNEELMEITIDELHGWEDPIVVTFPDDNEMGRIKLTKTDAETSEKIAGAEFTVTAAEDIVTPEGTVRLKKGETADVFTTGKDGTGESKELFLGRYTVQESKALQGYILDKTVYGIELTYQDEYTPVVEIDLGEIRNKPTTIVLNKVKEGTDLALEGAAFQIWNAGVSDDIDPEMSVREIYTTDENGQIKLQYLSPGTYQIQEVQAPPGYVLNDTVYTFTIDENGLTEGVELYELTVGNDDTRIIGTTAKDPLTGTNSGITRENAQIIDTVAFENLVPGTEYVLRGRLMDRSTGEPVLIDGEEITAETTFTAEQADGTVDVVFDLNAYDLKGMDIVVFEKVYIADGNIEVSGHEDIEDEGQTITYIQPEIGTTAKDPMTGTKEGIARQEAVIVDTVQYTGLIKGLAYIVRGTIYDKETKAPLLADGRELTAETAFTAEAEEGSVDVSFTLDASELQGKEIVVFEKAFLVDEELGEIGIAEHEDIEDEGQTVTYIQPQIGTTAVNKEDGTHTVLAGKITIVDTVEYSGLAAGVEYTVKGVLMDKEDGKPVKVDGKEVTAETEFTAEEPEGSIDVAFAFDASGLSGKDLVVFESVYISGTDVLAAEHSDIDDQSQTVSVKTEETKQSLTETKPDEGVKTGDITNIWKYAVLLALSAAIIIGIILQKRNNGRRQA